MEREDVFYEVIWYGRKNRQACRWVVKTWIKISISDSFSCGVFVFVFCHPPSTVGDVNCYLQGLLHLQPLSIVAVMPLWLEYLLLMVRRKQCVALGRRSFSVTCSPESYPVHRFSFLFLISSHVSGTITTQQVVCQESFLSPIKPLVFFSTGTSNNRTRVEAILSIGQYAGSHCSSA